MAKNRNNLKKIIRAISGPIIKIIEEEYRIITNEKIKQELEENLITQIKHPELDGTLVHSC